MDRFRVLLPLYQQMSLIRSFLLVQSFFASRAFFCACTFVLWNNGVSTLLVAQPSASTSPSKLSSSIDVSLGVFGQLTQTRTPQTDYSYAIPGPPPEGGTTTSERVQGASPSAGVLGTVHQSFGPWLGYAFNVGYTNFAEHYSTGFAFVPSRGSVTLGSSNFQQGQIETNMYETTVAYLLRGPNAPRFHTFAQVGGGGLWFQPTENHSPSGDQIRLAMVFGAGLNYELSSRFAIRAEYRGLFYKGPDFKEEYSPVPVTRLFTVTSEPTVSLVYTFAKSRSCKNGRH
jgi:opacity protein-like surface antigen